MSALLLVLVLLQPPTVKGRPYHRVALPDVATTKWTHVITCGLVTYSRTMADGDRHITLRETAAGEDFVVLETIPALPLQAPRKEDKYIEAWGIARIDRGHRTPQYPAGWPELHPLEGWRPVGRCPS